MGVDWGAAEAAPNGNPWLRHSDDRREVGSPQVRRTYRRRTLRSLRSLEMT